MANVDTTMYFPFSIFKLSATTVVIDSLKLTFLCDATAFFGVSLTGSNAIFFFFFFLAGKTTEIIEFSH